MSNELKFDRARFEAGEMPTRTRDGRQVLWCADTGLDIGRPIVAVFEEGSKVPVTYTADGRFYSGESRESALDLIHEPKMRKVRIAVCRDPYDVETTLTVTSDSKGVDFDVFLNAVRKNSRLLHLLEVEVPE